MTDWHTRFFAVAGITLAVASEWPLTEATLAPKFKLFETDGPGRDTVYLYHRFADPVTPDPAHLHQPVYQKSPWAIYRHRQKWLYLLETSPDPARREIRQMIRFTDDHTRAEFWNNSLVKAAYENGGLGSLTMSPTDQVLLARLLADRQGCYLHSDGIRLDQRGFLFVGHSGAGKSTVATLLQDRPGVEILCDDRMIIRHWPDGFRIHGNWSHGTLPLVSAADAPLSAIFFLHQATRNAIEPVTSTKTAFQLLISCLIKPLVTRNWWENMLDLSQAIVTAVPCFYLYFDKSGDIYPLLKELAP